VARSLPEFVSDARTLIRKKKLKAARKTIDKAVKQGLKGPLLQEATAELLLAEGGGEAAAAAMREVGRVSRTRIPALLKIADTHLRAHADDHLVRDVAWELALQVGAFDVAVRHLDTLVKSSGTNTAKRAQELVARKDEVGAVGIFLLASLGGVNTDRLKLAKRLLKNDVGSRLLEGVVGVLHDMDRGVDGPVYYVLAQLAHRAGDREAFLESGAAAAEELRDEMITWTGSMDAGDRLELALRLDALEQVISAAADASTDSLVATANRVQGDAISGRVIRGLAALVNDKPSNACRILEEVVRRDKSAADPLAQLLKKKSGIWTGAREAHAAVVAEGLWGDREKLDEGADSLMHVGSEDRGEAWLRVARRLLERAASHGELRCEVGRAMLANENVEDAVALLTAPEHISIAEQWVADGHKNPEVLRTAAELAEKYDQAPAAAEWLLRAAVGDKDLLAEVGRRLQGSTVSLETALESANALLDQNQKQEAAGFLSRLPLDPETGKSLDDLLEKRKLRSEKIFEEISLRTALALGDLPRAKRHLKAASSGMEALASEAKDHGNAARVLAELLVREGAAPTAVKLLDARREAGDPPRGLLPLVDTLTQKSPQLASARLLRARLLAELDRKEDAVRDLRAIPGTEAEADEAFALLGELEQDESAGKAALGRVDILVAKKDYKGAIKELSAARGAPAGDRLDRLERITKEKPDLEPGQHARAVVLLEMKRVEDAAEAHFARFDCTGADPAAISTDLEALATETEKAKDIAITCSILERLPDRIHDGAERAINLIADDAVPPLLILKSQLLLQRERTDEAVRTLSDLVDRDEKSRTQAAKALQAIVESGQARPNADFALSRAFEALEQKSQALGALKSLYEADLTSKESVLKHTEGLVLRSDDPDVRLFLADICLDLRDAGGATEHCVHARRLQPGTRRNVVARLQRALDLDAFSANTHFALAEAHLAGDEADDAVRHFRAAVEVDRGSAAAAIEALEEAAPRSKRPAMLWLAVGTTYAEFQRAREKAVAAYSHGLEANPRTEIRIPLLLGRGDAYAALNQEDAAFDDFDAAAQQDLLERRYYEYLRSRHRKRVLLAAREGQKLASSDFGAAVGACARYIKLGMHGDSVSVAQAALASDPNDLRARYLVGISLHAGGRLDAAARALEAVRSGSGADTEIGRASRMFLAEAYLDQGDRDKARACLVEIESVNAAYPGLESRRRSLAPPADDPHAPPPLFVRPEFPRPTE